MRSGRGDMARTGERSEGCCRRILVVLPDCKMTKRACPVGDDAD